MDVAEISAGVPHIVHVLADGSRNLPDVQPGLEIELQRSTANGRLFARANDMEFAIRGASDEHHSRLEDLVVGGRALVGWVLVARQGSSGVDQIVVSILEFGVHLRWKLPVSIVVDERTVERLRQSLGDSRLDIVAAQQWLRSEFQLPPVSGHDDFRYVAALSPGDDESAGRSFQLLGKHSRLDVVVGPDDRLQIRRIRVERSKLGVGWRLSLISGAVEFIDATVAGRLADEIKSELQDLAAGGGRYLKLWAAYLEGEKRQLEETARALGAIPYRSVESRGGGIYRFDVDRSHEGAAALLWEVEEDVDLEAVSVRDVRNGTATLSLDDAEAEDEIVLTKRPDAFSGTLDQQALRRGIVELRVARTPKAPPPVSGVLRLSLLGDRIVIDRRERAMAKIRASSTPMRHLGLLLEDRIRTAVGRTRKRIDPYSPRVSSVVGGDLTVQQRRALDVALNTPDIALIQGPPGTGKTRVIAALQQRLAEEAMQSQRLTGKVLITSFQHEAVENVVSAAQVFGLPAIRVGESRRKRAAAKPFDIWREQQAARVKPSLRELGFEVAEVHRRLRTISRSYSRLPGGPEEAATLLDGVLDMAGDHLSPDLTKRIREHLRAIRRSRRFVTGVGTEELATAIRYVRALRTEQGPFDDDGPATARRAAQWLHDLSLDGIEGTVAELRAVSRQQDWEPAAAERLRQLKASLLDRLLVSCDAPPLVDATVETLLRSSVDELSKAVRRSPAGLPRAVARYLEDLETDPGLVYDTLQKYSSVVAATCQHAASGRMMSVVPQAEFETVVVDEAARANPLDLFIPMSLAKDRIVLVGDHRQLPHLIEHQLERVLEERLPELQTEWRQSLFERLFKSVLRDLERLDGVPRIVTLDTQFRMHPALGRFVSEQFYEIGEDSDRVTLLPGRQAAEFAHAFPGYQDRVATWLDVPFAEGQERAGVSKHRPVEARRIALELKRLMDDPAGIQLTFGVIAFYRRQVVEVEDALCQLGVADRSRGKFAFRDAYREHRTADGRIIERLRVGTVDEFQGREFDVVFLSVTRSNAITTEDPGSLRRKYGHLMLANRMCVAMSRQRRLLVVAGDRSMLRHPSAHAAVPALVAFDALASREDHHG